MQETKNSITFQQTLRWRNTHRVRSLLKYKVTTETHLQQDHITKEKQHRTHERYVQNVTQLVHLHHRSVHDFSMNLLAAIGIYCFFIILSTYIGNKYAYPFI